MVTSKTLSENISRLHRSGEEYGAAFEQFIYNLCKLDLECENIPSHSQLVLGQDLINRRQEEEETLEQAGAQLERLRRLEDGDEDDESRDQECEPFQQFPGAPHSKSW